MIYIYICIIYMRNIHKGRGQGSRKQDPKRIDVDTVVHLNRYPM